MTNIKDRLENVSVRTSSAGERGIVDSVAALARYVAACLALHGVSYWLLFFW